MGITGPAAFPNRWRTRLLASASGLALLVWVGAISPHLVHHLFETDAGQACPMLAEADGSLCLIIAPPSLVLPQVPQQWRPIHPRFYAPALFPITGQPRAPPSMPV